jgi:hypothetical protein
MFRRHRDDLLSAQENERRAKDQVITVLADQVEYLRYLVSQQPHMSPALRGVTLETPEAPEADGFRPWMSEEEEEMLALNLNEHITDADLEALRGEVAHVIPLPRLEADD